MKNFWDTLESGSSILGWAFYWKIKSRMLLIDSNCQYGQGNVHPDTYVGGVIMLFTCQMPSNGLFTYFMIDLGDYARTTERPLEVRDSVCRQSRGRVTIF